MMIASLSVQLSTKLARRKPTTITTTITTNTTLGLIAGEQRRSMTTQPGIKEKGRRLDVIFSFYISEPCLFFFPRRVVYSKGLKRKKAKNKNKNKKHKQNEHSLGCVLGLGY